MDIQRLEKIIILDFGSQTTRLIATRLRSLGFYAQIHAFDFPARKIKKLNARGLIFSGGPKSLYEKASPRPDPAVYDLGLPILGICYGLQLITRRFKGQVIRGALKKEYGQARLSLKKSIQAEQNSFTAKISAQKSVCWMSHGDEIEKMPPGFKVLGSTPQSPYAIIANLNRQIYAVQFHPEVSHTLLGPRLLKNFANRICQMRPNWKTANLIKSMISELRRKTRGRRVLHAISGGVDSTVMAAILHKAISARLKCVMVDTGLLRKDEVQNVQKRFKKYLKTPVKIVNAQKIFLKRLENITSGQKRRQIIGKTYIDVFQKHLGPKDFLAQGTLYPDVIESAVGQNTPAHTIKTHHNRAPEVVKLMEQGRIIEIFKDLFKDEVRAIGRKLNLPEEIVERQPFPGPGLAIRILGKITPEKLETLRQADAIVIDELKKADLYFRISQTVIALDSHQVTCVKGDAQARGYLIFIRNVQTTDFMTAAPFELPQKLRQKISTRVLNQVPLAGRVLFDESTKPPATICYL
ncbi:MAG: glutamine-hydrolyzing GMP synthase [Patescibacteria group bacterium]|nr:glutamine-hydrolyzing GMP synthase [Patescibacteria group bacterium]